MSSLIIPVHHHEIQGSVIESDHLLIFTTTTKIMTTAKPPAIAINSIGNTVGAGDVEGVVLVGVGGDVTRGARR
jgi:hypothetical protein